MQELISMLMKVEESPGTPPARMGFCTVGSAIHQSRRA